MNHVEIVKKYLQNHEDVDITPTGFPFVTISRQAGALGHSLGREILRIMADTNDPQLNEGWEMFDQKLCALIASDPKLNASFESLVAEEYRSEISRNVFEMFMGQSEQYKQQKKIAEVIRLVATLGKVVIVGRGGQCITRDMKNGIRIRLVADPAIRVHNLMREMELSESEARKAMIKQDRDREKMTREFYRRNIEDPLLYDIVWNSGQVDIREIAEITAEMIKRRMPKRKKLPSSFD